MILLKLALFVLLLTWSVESQSQPQMLAANYKRKDYVSYHAVAGIVIAVLLAVGVVLLAIFGVWYYFHKKLLNQQPQRIIEHVEEPIYEEEAPVIYEEAPEVVHAPTAPKKDYSKEKDDVLRKLGEWIDQYGIVKLAEGKYQIKSKIVYMKIMGEGVYVRVGGGYVKFEQWITTYFKDLRADKMRNNMEKKEDV